MTSQEVFDTVVKHLAAQGWERSVNGGNCAYRAPDGKKCAIGALLLDDDVVEEGCSVWEMPPSFRKRLGNDVGLMFLESLQRAHDTGYAPWHMIENFRHIARDRALTWPL